MSYTTELDPFWERIARLTPKQVATLASLKSEIDAITPTGFIARPPECSAAHALLLSHNGSALVGGVCRLAGAVLTADVVPETARAALALLERVESA